MYVFAQQKSRSPVHGAGTLARPIEGTKANLEPKARALGSTVTVTGKRRSQNKFLEILFCIT